MTQFHEGQEVEVLALAKEYDGGVSEWRKAEIVCVIIRGPLMVPTVAYIVQFTDSSRVVFDAAHIRAVSPLDERFNRAPTTEAEHRTLLAGDSAEEYPGLAEPDDDTSEPMGRGSLDDPGRLKP